MEKLRLQLENGLNQATREAYAKIGRPQDAGDTAAKEARIGAAHG